VTPTMASHPNIPEGRAPPTEHPPVLPAAPSAGPPSSTFAPPRPAPESRPTSPELEAEPFPEAPPPLPLPAPLPPCPLLLPPELLLPVELLADPVLEPAPPELELDGAIGGPPELLAGPLPLDAELVLIEPLDEPDAPLDEPDPGRKHAANETDGLPLLLLPP